MDNKIWDYIVKGLSILVIPLIIWGAALQSKVAVQDEKLETLKSEVEKTRQIETGIHNNSLSLARLEEKLNATNKSLEKISNLLDSPR
jgi:hypothetical protein